jgi:alkyl sulfatase BDS1-like metallo-beta-lactamase superfamily hydrolase
LIAGFGGPEAVRTQALGALADDDLRWALELATWLVRSASCDPSGTGAQPEDRELLASVLRTIGQRTTSANIRNWCLTRARELEGVSDLARFRRPRFSIGEIMAGRPETYVHVLRVMLVPELCDGVDVEIGWQFTDGATAGLHVRNFVAAPTDGTAAAHRLELDRSTWASILAGRTSLDEAIGSELVNVHGDVDVVRSTLACFEHPSLGGTA